MPAPPRFLPEFDNVLLAHVDRSRIVPPPHRGAVFVSGGLMSGTVLLDGFVQARWTIERRRRTATLTLTPLAPLAIHDRTAAIDEGARFLTFVDPEAEAHDVHVARTDRSRFPKP
jgi:hypothetical protein